MPIARINGHTMYYEVLGHGDPVLCMGGWGTFCHDNHGQLARGLTDRYQVVIFDYRGIRDSDDDLSVPSTMELHAGDAIGLLDHLGLRAVHLVGLVGMGACVCQEIAIRRPDLARSMLNMGAWCEVDDFLRDQLEMFRWIHRDLGFCPSTPTSTTPTSRACSAPRAAGRNSTAAIPRTRAWSTPASASSRSIVSRTSAVPR
jgi:3-oxoadipate enol-lactonase